MIKIRDLKKIFFDSEADKLYVKNTHSVAIRNSNMVTLLLLGCIAVSIVNIFTGLFDKEYADVVIVYSVAILLCISTIYITRQLKGKYNLFLVYSTNILFVSYGMLSSLYFWPNDACVSILASCFLFPTLFIDKSWRINLFMILFIGIYTVLLIFFKSSDLVLDEIVNIVGVSIFACIVGSFVRKGQLKYFDSEQTLRISEAHYLLALKHSDRLVGEYDIKKKTVTMTKDVANYFMESSVMQNVPYEQVQKCSISADTTENYINFFKNIDAGKENDEAVIQYKTKDGWRWLQAYSSTIFNDNNEPVSSIVSFIDVTEQREMDEKNLKMLQEEQKLKMQVKLDGLTGVYNKKTIEDIVKGKLEKNNYGIMLIIDIDDLKIINDKMGHPQGDLAIKSVAHAFREVFNKNADIGRIGGDEFIVYINELLTPQKFRRNILQCYKILHSIKLDKKSDREIHVSVGVVFNDGKYQKFEKLYSIADKALYNAKNHGKNKYLIYSNDDD